MSKRLFALAVAVAALVAVCLAGLKIYTEKIRFSQDENFRRVFAQMNPAGDGAPAPGPRIQNPVALTFDDGPHPDYTPQLLEIMRSFNAKCTFFLVGKMAAKHPDLVKAIHDAGHEIGNHSYNHPVLTRIPQSEVYGELARNNETLERVTGEKMKYFRPPSGRYNTFILKTAADMGLLTIYWSRFPADYGCTDRNVVRKRVVSGLRPGDIVILHSGVDATIQALPLILAELRDAKFTCVTVTDLLKSGGDAVSGPIIYRVEQQSETGGSF